MPLNQPHRRNARFSLLRVLLRTPHRFRRVRALTSSLSLILLAAVPLTGIGRLDLWGGVHLKLGQSVPWTTALGVLFLAGGAIYSITFLVNLIGGRLFCGYGCPLAFVTRVGEKTRTAGSSSGRRIGAQVVQIGYAALFAASIVLWWVDPRVLVEGSLLAQGLTIASILSITVVVLAHGRWIGWRFCKTWCPVEIYYSIVSPTKSWGLAFDHPVGTCVDCAACDQVCPVDLKPRTLEQPTQREEGLAIDGIPGLNHCLSCGDCIEACELVMDKHRLDPAPLRFRWFPTEPVTPHSESPCAASTATGNEDRMDRAQLREARVRSASPPAHRHRRRGSVKQ